MQVLLSVIVPTYNCGDYVEECINSIINQLPEQCEIIAVDDGSTDDTRDKLRALSAQCDKLRVYHRQSDKLASVHRRAAERICKTAADRRVQNHLVRADMRNIDRKPRQAIRKIFKGRCTYTSGNRRAVLR